MVDGEWFEIRDIESVSIVRFEFFWDIFPMLMYNYVEEKDCDTNDYASRMQFSVNQTNESYK